MGDSLSNTTAEAAFTKHITAVKQSLRCTCCGEQCSQRSGAKCLHNQQQHGLMQSHSCSCCALSCTPQAHSIRFLMHHKSVLAAAKSALPSTLACHMHCHAVCQQSQKLKEYLPQTIWNARLRHWPLSDQKFLPSLINKPCHSLLKASVEQ